MYQETIKVKMYDNYYEPNSFNIKKGETIKFEVSNLGELAHEFNIANAMMHLKTSARNGKNG